jgi:hypothetical protein
MSEDWKSDKAEAAMREGTEVIRKAAELRAELKINYELPEKRD